MNNYVNSINLNIFNCNNKSFYNGIGTNCCLTGIKPYCSSDCCNQCGKCFCCNCCCCPVVPTAPMPPMPPLPPIPPIPPPVPGGSFGQFNAPTQVINGAGIYNVNPINIQGDAVEFDPGTNTITLKPNTTYRYSYMAETVVLGAVPSDITNAVLLGNASIPGTESTTLNVQPGVLTMIQSNGQFVTGNAPLNFSLGIITNPAVQVETSATLTVEEILP